ncbi:MAG: sigma-54-dependent Fis family transcriptional regulator [Myxococcales bacterium]|nr:sigma-54-dependent Fis family transcriptional regulator [Myxococcales bacterium]
MAAHRRLLAEEEPERLLEVALEALIGFLDADRGFALLREADGRPRLRAVHNVDLETVRAPHFRPLRRIADETLRQGEPFLSASLDADTRVSPESSLVDAARTVMVLPVRARDHVLGVLYADRYHEGDGGFVVADLRVAQGFAETVGLALSRLRDSRELGTRVTELRRTQATLERMTTSLHEEVAAKSVEIARFERDLDSKLRALGLKHGFGNIVGKSPRMQAMFEVLRQVADYAVPVLILGESGTGKELIARALHYESNRAAEPFVAINCAAIPEHLLESELFGFKRGAFTGAHRDKPGLFRAAGAGTLLLDEIGDMPLPLQAKLLRVLQEREVQPIGGTAPEPVEARVVAATKRRLREEVARGGFREDLYYRLNMVEVEVPPLRERLEDVPVLAEHFLERLDQELGLPRRTLSREALRRLMHFDWPGNVRQLENAVQSSAILSRGAVVEESELRLPDMPPAAPPPPPSPALAPGGAQPAGGIQTRDEWDALEKNRILDAMVQSGWNKSRAATILGVSRRNLYRKLARHGIEGGD